MHYISTRGTANDSPREFCDIVLEGLAPDGGLYLPQAVPVLSKAELEAMRHMHYHELAFAIISRFATDIPADDLKGLIDRAYTAEAFGTEDITPLVPLEPGLSILKLSNGPTLAFKDIAMRFLGELFP
ncbi:MAG: threonine synthase, partial [Betaproteobacteria bacterium]|nr:threonine synthase [Betaproteobacteria bacterium]